jgi:hypothetical protein
VTSGSLPSSKPSAWTPGRVLLAALAAALLLALVEAGAGAGVAALRPAVALAAYLLSAGAAWWAARIFSADDYLRRAWELFALNPLALAVGRLLKPDVLSQGPLVHGLLAAVTLLANAFAVGGMVLFALMWSRTGLPLPLTRRQKVVVALLLGAATVLTVGPDLASMTARAAQGDVVSLSLAVGDACDVAVFLLVVPVFLTARAFSGGSLAWPFGLLSASTFAWLLLDAFATYGDLAGVTPGTAAVVSGSLRTLACCLLAAAGVTQRLALQDRPE